MRRRPDLLLAAVAAVVVAVAALDALRPGEPVAEPAHEADTAEAAGRLAGLGVGGALVYSDEACDRRRLALPALRHEDRPVLSSCAVFAARGSLGVHGGDVLWVAYQDGFTTVLTRDQLATAMAAATLPRRPASSAWEVRRVAWLGRRVRYAAVVSAPGLGHDLLVLFRRREVERVLALVPPGRGQLRASPRGAYLASIDPGGRITVYDGRGEPLPLPAELRAARAVAWSPDERFAAFAVGDEIHVVPSGQFGVEPVRIPVAARDVAWQRSS
jgi:hypothetical protein